MKRYFLLLFLIITFSAQAQEKISISPTEITIPIGKKILLKPNFKDSKVIDFKLIEEEDLRGTIDLFDILTNFKKDNLKDNSIEIKFSEAKMMTSTVFVLIMVQKTGKKMSFKAKIRKKGTSTYAITSIVPSVSNSAHVEQWQDNIDSIILYDFELLD